MLRNVYWRIRYFIERNNNRRLRKKNNGLYYDRLVGAYRHTDLDECEHGDINYIMSELVRDNLYYEYRIGEVYNHSHSFNELIEDVYLNADEFIMTDKGQFSEHELRFINKVVEAGKQQKKNGRK